MGSTYFRFPKAGVCCPCVPPTGVCLGGTPVIEIGNNVPQTKTIRFGGDNISDGNPCGTATARCDNLFNVPIVLDLNQAPPATTSPQVEQCHFGYTFPVEDADCNDNAGLDQIGGYFMYLEEDGTNTQARYVLEVWDTFDGSGVKQALFQWTSPWKPVPVDMTAEIGPLAGTFDNSGLFGAPSTLACHYQNVTAEILA